MTPKSNDRSNLLNYVRSLDYVTSVDLRSEIIAMEYPSTHTLRLYIALFQATSHVGIPSHTNQSKLVSSIPKVSLLDLACLNLVFN